MSQTWRRTTFLRAARVYTAEGDPPILDGVVAVEGDAISRVAPAADLRDELDSATAEVVDYGDATLLPGMVDAHCHMTLTGDGRTYEEEIADPDEMMSLVGIRNLQSHLARGVTTIRDNGGRNRVVFVVREAAQRGYFVLPRLLLSGRPVTHTYGHFYWCNGVADADSEIRAAVRQLVAEGADHIKIMASGGATAGNIPYYPSYTAAEMRVAVETAHGLGRLTTAHCRAKQSMLNAVEAGLDCIEHAEYLVPGELIEFGGGVASSGRMVYDPRVTERLLESGMFVSFTMQAGGYDTLLALRDRASQGTLGEAENARLSALQAYYDMKLEIFGNLLRDGVMPRLAISSDAGPFDTSFSGLQYGLELAVEGGMSPAEAVTAATRIAAEACGVAAITGTLTMGKQADVLVVDGDPLHDISAMRRVRAVYLAGNLVAPLLADSGAHRQEPVPTPQPRPVHVDC